MEIINAIRGLKSTKSGPSLPVLSEKLKSLRKCNVVSKLSASSPRTSGKAKGRIIENIPENHVFEPDQQRQEDMFVYQSRPGEMLIPAIDN